MFVIAPLDANTMAKLSHGMCDNLLTSVARAWDPMKPVYYCPAMNTYMWEHPLTQEHIEKLQSLKYIQIPPVSKTLACGDHGKIFIMSIFECFKYIPLTHLLTWIF